MAVDHSRDGESRSAGIYVVLSVCSAVSTLAVALRSYTRLALARTVGHDDAVMVAAQVLVVATAVAIGLETKYGLGSHSWLQPEEYFVPYMKAFYSSVIIYTVATCLVKISILLQYRRIFSVGIMQPITFYSIIFLSVSTITFCCLLALVCIPVAKFWDNTVPGRCLDSLSIWYTIAALNIATDFFIFGLPLPAIWALQQMPQRQKFMLSGAFGLGLFSCIISVIRIVNLKVVVLTEDPNWDNVNAAKWSFLELTIAVLAACLPTLRPICSAILPRLFGSSHGKSGVHVSTRTIPTLKTESTTALRNPTSIELVTSKPHEVHLPGTCAGSE